MLTPIRHSNRRAGLNGFMLLVAFAVEAMQSRVGLVDAAEAPQLAIYAMNGDGAELRQVAQAPGKR